MRRSLLLDGVVVDEDFRDWIRRPLAADFFKIQPE
jgi:hypothetical protein